MATRRVTLRPVNEMHVKYRRVFSCDRRLHCLSTADRPTHGGFIRRYKRHETMANEIAAEIISPYSRFKIPI